MLGGQGVCDDLGNEARCCYEEVLESLDVVCVASPVLFLLFVEC